VRDTINTSFFKHHRHVLRRVPANHHYRWKKLIVQVAKDLRLARPIGSEMGRDTTFADAFG
jgi:hypothetical protein